MKPVLNYILLMLMAVFSFTACSKSDNPADNDLFVGTYKGDVSYLASGNSTKKSGSITVLKTGDNYVFNFNSSDIPSISGIKIEKGQQGYMGTVNGYTGVITINAKALNIAVIKNGASWGADCTR
ncbi:MAG TPA: hypothetical protein PLL63_07990 [Niabella sp.]|nr:hypothetical protein [Niabella sp.]HRB64532.1 hypothetical protein [Niabella sp.]HRB74929.1 hypothetical protein [Niabella sp.]